MTALAQSMALSGANPFPMRRVLLDLAIRSALLRLGRKSGDCPLYDSAEWHRGEHPMVKLYLSIHSDMRALGEALRDTGEDARNNPLFASIEGACAYETVFEAKRREFDEAIEAHHALAETDRAAWLARFDDNGRYYDAKTGFWASLNGEFRVRETGEWVPADE